MESHLLVPDGSSFIVGITPEVLTNRYDANQYWFAFMAGVVFTPIDTSYDATPHRLVPQEKIERKKYARIEPRDRVLFRYVKGIAQFVLPFPNTKRLSNRQFKLITDAEFPAWERNENGSIFAIQIQDRPFDPPEWCLENFVGRFFCSRQTIVCELESDATLAKLVFG